MANTNQTKQWLPAHWQVFLGLILSLQLTAVSAAEQTGKPSPEAVKAMSGFELADGFEVNAYASEPLLGNPVSFCLDEQGRIYVAESYRFGKGTTDNRGHQYWLLDDLAAKTVEDRLEKFKTWAERGKHPMSFYTDHADQVRRIVDTDGDGRADRSNIFAGGFNEPLDGLAAGVLAYNDTLYFTCIPHLWMLKDTDGDGEADVRKKRHSGFGVRSSLLGHDMHGLALGPDGRIYFSIGDRGYNVTTDDGRQLVDPMDVGRGAVFRCEPDGSNLEIVHYGLRNPQELAFDNYGNLFSVDNNSDAGDKARLVYIVEGGDSGWLMPFQTMGEGFYNDRGPWHAEKLWHLEHEGQPAWIVPPIDHITSGPSGFAHYPGVGLPDRYDGHFLICDFRGNPANSGVRSFAVQNDGAGFKMVDTDQLIWRVLATDVDFGYDGRIYVSDWINGWSGTGDGRIYTLQNPETVDDPKVKETQRLFAEGFQNRSNAELSKLLRHPDQRVRTRAELALADRGDDAVEPLKEAAVSAEPLVARLHGIWGLGVVGRRDQAEILADVVPLLEDDNAEVRAQVSKVIGDATYKDAASSLVPLLEDPSLRVRYFAAQSLGELEHEAALEPLVRMLRANRDNDVYLRHAGVMALSRIADTETLLRYQSDDSAAVRRAVVLALRQKQDPKIAQFLYDSDKSVATEAARGIYDLEIGAAMPALADQIENYTQQSSQSADTSGDEQNDPLVRRIINANFRLGESKHAEALAAFVANPANIDSLRLEAVRCLADWTEPSPRERIMGRYRPLENRPAEPLREAIRPHLPQMLATASDELQAEITQLATQLNLETSDEIFLTTIGSSERSPEARVQALRYLNNQNHPRTDEMIRTALHSDEPKLRAEARGVLVRRDAERGLQALEKALNEGGMIDRQQAFATLGELDTPQAGKILSRWLKRFQQGEVAPTVQLDLLQAAEQNKSVEVQQQLKAYKETISEDKPLEEYLVTLEGGDPIRGRDVFYSHSAAQCVRCHTIDGNGGLAGPNLSDIGERVERKYILESLLQPNAQIAEGYEMVTLITKDNMMLAGTVQSESDEEIVIATPGGQVFTVQTDNVETREVTSASSMPPMIGILSKSEIRDLIAFLETLK